MMGKDKGSEDPNDGEDYSRQALWLPLFGDAHELHLPHLPHLPYRSITSPTRSYTALPQTEREPVV